MRTILAVAGLLLSSTTAAAEFIDTDRPACRALAFFAAAGAVKAEWTGRCLSGFAEGPGTLRVHVGGQPHGTYKGVLRRGQFQAYAMAEMPAGTLAFGLSEELARLPVDREERAGDTPERKVQRAVRRHVLCMEVELSVALNERFYRVREGIEVAPFAMHDLETACARTHAQLSTAAAILGKARGVDEQGMAGFVREIDQESQRAIISALWLARSRRQDAK